MMNALETSTRRVAELRQRGNLDDLAEALVLHANDLLTHGRTGDARQALDEASAIHRARGRGYDEARCMQFAATLCRFEGKLDEAKRRANQALELVAGKGPIAVSAHAELGEIALAEGLGAEAVAAYGDALTVGAGTGLIPQARAALLRKQAAALVTIGRYHDAVAALETAHDLHMRERDRASALRTLIEQATALQQGDLYDEAESVVERALASAEGAQDHVALSDIHLLRTTQAIARRDAQAAMASAQEARKQSLAANSPTSYIGAAVAIAQLAEMDGDRLAAYEALAVAWVTLADLVGQDIARITFAPKLSDLRGRWGEVAFDAIKKTYEDRRRQPQGRA